MKIFSNRHTKLLLFCHPNNDFQLSLFHAVFFGETTFNVRWLNCNDFFPNWRKSIIKSKGLWSIIIFPISWKILYSTSRAINRKFTFENPWSVKPYFKYFYVVNWKRMLKNVINLFFSFFWYLDLSSFLLCWRLWVVDFLEIWFKWKALDAFCRIFQIFYSQLYCTKAQMNFILFFFVIK